jgi:hypothetical protein
MRSVGTPSCEALTLVIGATTMRLRSARPERVVGCRISGVRCTHSMSIFESPIGMSVDYPEVRFIMTAGSDNAKIKVLSRQLS